MTLDVRIHGHWLLAVIMALGFVLAGSDGETARLTAAEPQPWWKAYHTVLSHPWSKRDKAWQLGAMAERSAWATGWYGAWWIQHQLELKGRQSMAYRLDVFRKQGIKNVVYYDAGEFGEFVILAQDGRIVLNQWQFPFYRGETGRLMWFGKNGFYQDKHLLKLKNYQDFGLPAWTYPDGKRAGRVFELARRSIDGKRDAWDYSHLHASNETARRLKLAEFLKSTPDPVPPGANMSLGRICSYDHSNPFLLKDFETGVGMMLTLKPAFLHFDNYFDNQTLYPAQQAFGPWSLERFRRYLHEHCTADELRQCGIENPDRFDLKQYIENKPFKSRGHRWHWNNVQWCDDLVWNLFLCSKVADANRLFRQLYAFCKTESRRLGREVVVVGNTNPLFPGRVFAKGALDIAHFEHHAARQHGPVVIPTGLPPLGRLGGVVRLGAAISRAGYCWPTVYVPKELSGEGHENLHKVLAMDCLANKGVLDYNYQYLTGYSPGSDRSAAWADCFIKNAAEYYGGRRTLNTIGLVFPAQSILGSVTVFTLAPERCLYDYLGWAQCLTELHVQWDVLLDQDLTLDALQRFKAVVLPSVLCLSDKSVSNLRQYVRQGGRVVVSGRFGSRHGMNRHLWPRKTPVAFGTQSPADPPREHDAQWIDNRRIVTCPSSPGRTFYQDVAGGKRSKGKNAMRWAIDRCLPRSGRMVAVEAPDTVGVFLSREADGDLAVDLVNYDVEPNSDQLHPATGVVLSLRPPRGTRFVEHTASLLSPDLRVETPGQTRHATRTPYRYRTVPIPGQLSQDGRLRLELPEFSVYCRLSIRCR